VQNLSRRPKVSVKNSTGFLRKKVVIPNFITDVNKDIVPIDTEIFGNNVKTIVSMGRLDYLKGFDILINAFSEVGRHNSNWQLLIIGDGPLKEELKLLTLKLDIQSKVKFLGNLRNPFTYLKKSDLFVLSSRSECFGNVIIEAMACGLPVISTNYTRKELLKTTEIIAKHDFLYVYFADSHGNLNLNENYDNYRDSVEALRFNGKKVGFHLHNHTGRALMNYYFCKNNNIDIVDATISGLGKGLGNLKLEEIISNEYFPDLIDFIIKNNQHLGDIHLNPYNLISGRANITDNYAKQALKFNPSMSCFNKFVNSLRGRARDSFDSELLKIYMDKQ